MLTTKNIQQTERKTPKTLQPGNARCRIYNIELTPGYNPDSYNLMLHLESEPLGDDFEGFFIDKDDESKGKYAGQVGRVRASQYAFETKTLPNGNEINRDESILKVLLALAKAQGVNDQLDAVEAKTIEEYVEMARPILCNNIFLNYCLAGRQYQNKQGYPAFDLYLPKPKKGEMNKYAFSAEPDNVIEFTTELHITGKKAESRATDEFEPSASADEFTM